jgi:hypothetical protein
MMECSPKLIETMPTPSFSSLLISADQLQLYTRSVSNRKKNEGSWLVVEEGLSPAGVAALRAKGWDGNEVDGILDTENVLFVVLSLPTRDEAEIPDMIALQAEEFTPFPIERTCVGWEILGEESNGYRVLMALTSSVQVQNIRDQLKEVGIRVGRVDVTVLGWLKRLEREVSSDQACWVVMDGMSMDLIAWQGGMPCKIQNLGDLKECSAEEIAEELELAWMSVEAEWGVAAPTRIQMWHNGEVPEAWTSLPGVEVELLPLPEAGGCVQGCLERSEAEGALDLAPPEWEQEHQARLKRTALIRKTGWAAAVWMLALGGFMLFVQLKERDVRGLEEEVAAREAEKQQVELLGQQVRSLSQFTDRSSSVLEAIWVLAEAVPGTGTIEIDDFRFTKNDKISFSGFIGGSDAAFLTFIENVGSGDQLRVDEYKMAQERDGDRTFDATARWSWIPAPTRGNP